jgi:hypothetical protein
VKYIFLLADQAEVTADPIDNPAVLNGEGVLIDNEVGVESIGPVEDAPEVETIGLVEDAAEVETIGHIEDDKTLGEDENEAIVTGTTE